MCTCTFGKLRRLYSYDGALLQAPGSVVSYYQQVGRAGRGVDKAYGVLLQGDEDEPTHQHFAATAFPSQEDIDDILSALMECDDGLSEEELEEQRNIRPRHIVQVPRTTYVSGVTVFWLMSY